MLKWISAKPLEGKASLHEVSLWDYRRLGFILKHFHFVVGFYCNNHLPLSEHPQVLLTLHVRDADQASQVPHSDFCINSLQRWRLESSQFDSFLDYVNQLNHKHYHNFAHAQKIFDHYGATISCIEGDWSECAEDVYKLYTKVATKHGAKLYDCEFFRLIAKRKDYKLIYAQYQGTIIGAIVFVEEPPTMHSMCCGLDYMHSTKSFAYSKMHYEFIRLAIEKKFTYADVGVTADQSKRILGFQPVPTAIDLCVHHWLLRSLLRFTKCFMAASITPEAKIKIHFRW